MTDSWFGKFMKKILGDRRLTTERRFKKNINYLKPDRRRETQRRKKIV